METRSKIYRSHLIKTKKVGKVQGQVHRRGNAKRSLRRVERLEKRRRSEFTQLRWEDQSGQVWCEEHRKWASPSMLSLILSSCCRMEWKDLDLLLRSKARRSNREFSRSLDCQGLELRKTELNKGKSSAR